MMLDRISNLPSEVLVGEILSRLTMDEAVRTSVLSSQWRHNWAMLPDLVFGYSHSCPLKSSENHTVTSIINQILLAHIGPIRKFKLMKQPVPYNDVDRWILHLSRSSSSIEEFAYHSVHRKHEMPSCVYSFHRMIRLELWWCVLKPPSSTFRGFSSLKDLSLYAVDVAQDVLENMICCCPMLKRLSLGGCSKFSQFKINAPNLEYLSLAGVFGDISFLNTLKLIYVIYAFRGYVSSRSSCLLNFLAPLHHIQNLKIGLTCFAEGGILPQKLWNPLPDLKFLEMHIQCHDLKEILIALCLLRSSPALEKLVIRMGGLRADWAANSWLDDNHSCSFTELRHVEIYFTHCLQDELDLIQLLLSSSPMLETMTIVPGPEVDLHKSWKVVEKKLQWFRCASPNLEMKLLWIRPDDFSL